MTSYVRKHSCNRLFKLTTSKIEAGSVASDEVMQEYDTPIAWCVLFAIVSFGTKTGAIYSLLCKIKNNFTIKSKRLN
jgi:hypothetical protein